VLVCELQDAIVDDLAHALERPKVADLGLMQLA
jgi:hypothetical protein